MKSFDLHHRQMKILSEDAFKLWLELKSFNKVAKHMAGIGDANLKTGNPFTSATVADNIYRWVIENPDETKPLIEKSFYGQEIEQEQWNRWLVKTAMRVYDTGWERQKDWIIRHGMERYKDMWDARSPDGTLD